MCRPLNKGLGIPPWDPLLSGSGWVNSQLGSSRLPAAQPGSPESSVTRGEGRLCRTQKSPPGLSNMANACTSS